MQKDGEQHRASIFNSAAAKQTGAVPGGAQGPQPPPLPSRPPPPFSAAAPIHHRRGRLAHGPAPPRCQNAAEERQGGSGGRHGCRLCPPLPAHNEP